MNSRAAFFLLGLMLSGAAFGAFPVHAQIFGESDKEKAARQAHEDGQDAQITQLGNRIQQLEEKVQSLTDTLSAATGNNEQLNHQIQELRQLLAAQQKDFAYRLCMVSAQQLGAGGGDQGLNCGATGQTASAAPPPSNGLPPNYQPGQPLPPLDDQGFSGAPSSGAPQQLARPPGTLGTLPMDSGPQTASAKPSAGGGGSGQFNSAMNLLGKAQYAEASAAFRSFADNHQDDDDLAPQAIYWIGDIAYVQQDYPAAARAFAEQIKKYPSSSRSPDSMLKLGQSLIAEGQTSGGCTALAEVKIKYPKASEATLSAAAGARKVACR